MGNQTAKQNRSADLMGEDIIGTFLSEEVLHASNRSTPTEDKLQRFIHDQESIQKPRLLGSGIHGVVVLVVIKNAQYALKVFKNWKQPGPVFYPYEQAIYTSPLVSESRAFARLESRNYNGTWAAKCFGWMKLSDTQFKTIGEVANTHDLSRWVIVKEYLPLATDGSHIKEIFKNFEIPQKLGILPRDIRIENYRGSKIADLSCALTAPCPGWSDFEFEFFYDETVHGVFDWVGCQPNGLGQVGRRLSLE